MFQAWQCPPSVVRPLVVRARMPRRPRSVILRGWQPLAVKQVVKSAIVTLCGGSHLGCFLDPGVIHAHPLFRALCHGANASVVDLDNCHCYSGTFTHYIPKSTHAQATPTSLHPWHHLAPHSLRAAPQTQRFGVPKSRRNGSTSNYIYAKPAATLVPSGANLPVETANFSTV